jgi:hypothetical protein
MTLFLFLLWSQFFPFPGPGRASVSECAGYANGYDCRVTLTIDNTQVPATLTDFPVAFHGSKSYLADVGSGGKSKSSGNDIIFTQNSDGTGTQYKFHRILRTTAGAVQFRVKVTSVSSSAPTLLYLFVGKTSDTDHQDIANTYDASHIAYWPFPDGSTLDVNDVVGANDGTGVNTPSAVTGRVDGGLGLASASTEYVTVSSGINPAAITVMAWLNATTLTPAYSAVFSRIFDGSGTSISQLFIRSDGKIAVYLKATGVVSCDGTGTAVVTTGAWHHVAFSYDSSTGLHCYIDGVSDATASANGALHTGTSPTRIASDQFTAGREWNGTIDEMSAHSVKRATAWVTATFNNEKSGSTFLTEGTLQ